MLCYRCGSYTPDDSRKCIECGQPIAAARRQSRNLSGATAGKPVAIPPFEAGHVVARRYRIIGPAGAGTTGWVMRARDEEVDVEVGLKLIATNLLQTEPERSRFLKTVKQARKVHHTNVARVYDGGRDDRFVYYTMPFLEGLNLRKIIDLRVEKGETFDLAETLPLFTQLVQALDAMAKLGPHGALRPSNILVLPDVLKLTATPHFRGLPRRPFVALQSRVNMLEYLAPEARREDVAVDRRADVYSVAVIVGEMLTGTMRERDAKAWDEAQKALPRGVVVALHRGLADAPPSRFETPAQLVDALAAAAAEYQAASPVPRPMPDQGSGDSAPQATAPMPEEAEATDDPRRTVDLSGAAREALAPKTTPPDGTPISRWPSSVTDPMGRELSLEGPPAPGVARRGQTRRPTERRGGAHRGPWLPLAVAAILIAGVAVSVAIWWRHRSTIADPQPIQRGQAADTSSTSGSASAAGDDREKTSRPATRHGARARDKPKPRNKPKANARHRGRSEPVARRTTRAEPTPPALVFPPPRDHSSRRPAGAPPEPPAPSPPPAVISLVAQEPASSAPEPKPDTTGAQEPAGKSCPAGMVSVDGGSFELGSSPSDSMRGFGELPAQQRSLKAFCIDIYEYPNQRGKAPRVGISWTSAKRACERVGKRLCTEAEWEKACKGPGGTRFPFGNRYDPDACNISEGSGADRKPGQSGVFPGCRSGYGAVDLAGNVREWTASQFQKGASDKVIKGGAADDGAFTARCAARLNEPVAARQPNTGFRCCADPR